MEQPISISLCYHQDYTIVPPLCVPVQGGAAIQSAVRGENPDFGVNGSISEKNREYCELTVQYHAWKNIAANAYGFCHYRRFFCFNDNVQRPYLSYAALTPAQIARFFKTEDEITEYLRGCDILLPFAEDMGVPVAEHYCASKFHYKQDLELFAQVTSELFPELCPSVDAYLAQNKQYLCNMFIMKKEYFYEYCSFLFSILQEFDRRKERHGDFLSDRTNGYLGERFLGIYIHYIRQKEVTIKEVARIDIECSFKKRVLYYLLRPESKRRFLVKKISRLLCMTGCTIP